MKPVVKESEINIKIGFNEDKMPERIQFNSDNGGEPNPEIQCKAMMLSLFDHVYKDTLKIDLWTTEMQVVEMDHFIYNTLKGLADSYQRATHNTTLANDLQKFAQYFAEKTELFSNDTES